VAANVLNNLIVHRRIVVQACRPSIKLHCPARLQCEPVLSLAADEYCFSPETISQDANLISGRLCSQTRQGRFLNPIPLLRDRDLLARITTRASMPTELRNEVFKQAVSDGEIAFGL
jgi:hypothetical protein